MSSLQIRGKALSQTSPTSSKISITPANEQSVAAGSHEWFTGDVQVRALFEQILFITDGTGWVQEWGGAVREMHKGDVIWISAGVKHWHGATPTTAVTHLAIQETENGSAVNWMEQVTDEHYRQSR
jgi:hypothetical protein